ncbi:MAG: type II toxin-antitoxin system HigB family toxin [Bacteroidota bacterium]
MRIRLIKKKTIEQYAAQNAKSRSSFNSWLAKIKSADWSEPGNISDTFGSADLLRGGSERVVFNIAGNNYRMICKYWFGTNRVHLYVKWIGTHKEYDNLCNRQEQYSVNDY